MANFHYHDYDDGCHNFVVECQDRDELIRLKNWCLKHIGTGRVLVNDLFESSGVLKLVVTFAALKDARAFESVHKDKKPARLTLLCGAKADQPTLAEDGDQQAA